MTDRRVEDAGWEGMRVILDREMPQRRRPVIWWWWIGAIVAVLSFAGYAWQQRSMRSSDSVAGIERVDGRQVESLEEQALPARSAGDTSLADRIDSGSRDVMVISGTDVGPAFSRGPAASSSHRGGINSDRQSSAVWKDQSSHGSPAPTSGTKDAYTAVETKTGGVHDQVVNGGAAEVLETGPEGVSAALQRLRAAVRLHVPAAVVPPLPSLSQRLTISTQQIVDELSVSTVHVSSTHSTRRLHPYLTMAASVDAMTTRREVGLGLLYRIERWSLQLGAGYEKVHRFRTEPDQLAVLNADSNAVLIEGHVAARAWYAEAAVNCSLSRRVSLHSSMRYVQYFVDAPLSLDPSALVSSSVIVRQRYLSTAVQTGVGLRYSIWGGLSLSACVLVPVHRQYTDTSVAIAADLEDTALPMSTDLRSAPRFDLGTSLQLALVYAF